MLDWDHNAYYAAPAANLLPGAHVRRLLFWRYLLVWQKPAT